MLIIMGWFQRLKKTVDPQTDADIGEELRFHVDALTEEHRRNGRPPDEAREAALRRFGSMMSARDRVRDQATLR